VTLSHLLQPFQLRDRACHDEAWGSSLFAGLAGVSGGHPVGGVTAVQWTLGTVSKTVSKRTLVAEILRLPTRAVPEDFD
jgi:hypothetical protein